MFDIGFPELIVVSIIALLVVGPDKLPETVRTVALWVGRLKRSLANIKQEIENEIGADEIRQELHNESILKELNNTRHDLEDAIHTADRSFDEIRNVTNPVKPRGAVASPNPAGNPDSAKEEVDQPGQKVTSDNDRPKSESG